MAHKRTRSRPHAEFRHRAQIPRPAVEAVEQRLLDVLSPSLLAPRQLERRDPRQPHRRIRMRQRLLTWPVIVAIIGSWGGGGCRPSPRDSRAGRAKAGWGSFGGRFFCISLCYKVLL